MGILKVILSIVVCIVVAGVAIGGYFGFVPGVSTLFGSDKPRDLGAATTEADLVRVEGKLSQTLVAPDDRTPEAILRASVSGPVEATLTGREWAAHLDAMHPIRDVQVVFHTDGTFEASGTIEKDRIVPFVRMLGVSGVSDTEIVQNAEKYLPGNPVFYLKGRGAIANDAAVMTLDKAEIGRLAVPASWANDALVQYANAVLSTVPGLEVTSMTVVNGELQFEGRAPREYPLW